MKFTILLMLLGLTVLSCKKETKIETTKVSDSIIVDKVPADTIVKTVPVDTLHTDATGVQKDTASVIKK